MMVRITRVFFATRMPLEKPLLSLPAKDDGWHGEAVGCTIRQSGSDDLLGGWLATCRLSERTNFERVRMPAIVAMLQCRKILLSGLALMRSSTKKSRPAAGTKSERATNKRVASNADRNNGTGQTSMREEVTAYRQDLIVKAASDAFYEHGYHDCTVDMIAERLSGTKALVYYYFPDKRSILGEIFRRALIEAQEVIRKAIDKGNDPRDKLAAFARMYAGWVIDNQRIVAILWREERSISQTTRELVATERRTMDDLVALIVREGVSKGQFRVHDVRTTARAISGMISYTYSWWRHDRRLTKDDLANYYAQIVLRIAGVPEDLNQDRDSGHA